MDKQTLYTKLHDINNTKCEKLKTMDENEISYTILSEEIEDIACCLKALAEPDEAERNGILHTVRITTTSGSLYDVLHEFTEGKPTTE